MTASHHAFFTNTVSFVFSFFLIEPLNVCVLSNESNLMIRDGDRLNFSKVTDS